MKYKRRYKDYPPNVPRKLIKLYRSFNENGLATAKYLKVNDANLSKLFNKGIEPKDQSIRDKMFLPKIKQKREKRQRQPRPPEPQYIKDWRHLPTELRRRVIKQYMDYYYKKGGR